MARLALLFVIGTASAGQAPLACRAPSGMPRGLELFLDAQGFDSDRLVALADLDGDGRSEALVYLHGSDWCGSGGCTLLVLRGWRGDWLPISQIPATRPPVRLLERRHHGWRSLQVHIGGGGSVAHDAVLDFDGHRYVSDLTFGRSKPPANTAGHPLIDEAPDGTAFCER